MAIAVGLLISVLPHPVRGQDRPLPAADTLLSHWHNVPGIGFDTHVGRIESAGLDLIIYYDIGILAGDFVNRYRNQEDSSSAYHWIKNGEIDGGSFHYLLTQDSTLVATFPDEGPANFWVKVLHEPELNHVLDILVHHRSDLLATEYYPGTPCSWSTSRTERSFEEKAAFFECVRRVKPDDDMILYGLARLYIDRVQSWELPSDRILDATEHRLLATVDTVAAQLRNTRLAQLARRTLLQRFRILYMDAFRSEGVTAALDFAGDEISRHSTDSLLVARLYLEQAQLPPFRGPATPTRFLEKREHARQALTYDRCLSPHAYRLIAETYVQAVDQAVDGKAGGLNAWDRAVYWLVVDYLTRAIHVSASCNAGEAFVTSLERQRARYRQQLPTGDQRTELGVKAGDPFVVDYPPYEWINEATTVTARN